LCVVATCSGFTGVASIAATGDTARYVRDPNTEYAKRCLLAAVSGCEREREASRVPSWHAAIASCTGLTSEPAWERLVPKS
jgi:hypothetical protein